MKGQTSIEVIVLLSLMLGVFLIVIISNSSVLSILSSRTNNEKARSALDDVASAALEVYQQGEGAKSRVYVSIPSSIYNSTINNRTLLINLYAKGRTIQPVFRYAQVPLNGSLPNASGNYWVSVESFSTYVNVSY